MLSTSFDGGSTSAARSGSRLPRRPAHARRTGGPARPAARARRDRAAVDTAKVREWAKEQGIEVKDRGRIPASVVERYHTAAGGITTPHPAGTEPRPMLPPNSMCSELAAEPVAFLVLLEFLGLLEDSLKAIGRGPCLSGVECAGLCCAAQKVLPTVLKRPGQVCVRAG